MAAELGASMKTARRAALLHDIGKAVTHEVEGSHADHRRQLARKYGESNAVVARRSRRTTSTSSRRPSRRCSCRPPTRSPPPGPGARGESLENYVKRLEALEEIATSKPGVEKCYAMQAGREVRVMVKPEEIDDDAAVLLSHQIAREIEDSLEYPGPDQDHGDPRVAGDGVREVDAACPSAPHPDRRTFAGLIAAAMTGYLSIGVVIAVLPVYVKDSLGGSDVTVGIVLGAVPVGMLLTRPLAGR